MSATDFHLCVVTTCTSDMEDVSPFFGRAESFWSEHGYEPMQVSIFAEWGA